MMHFQELSVQLKLSINPMQPISSKRPLRIYKNWASMNGQFRVVLACLLKERDGLVCAICGSSLKENWNLYVEWLNSLEKGMIERNIKRKDSNIDIDHIKPRSLKDIDRHHFDNLRLTHMTCNNKRGNGQL